MLCTGLATGHMADTFGKGRFLRYYASSAMLFGASRTLLQSRGVVVKERGRWRPLLHMERARAVCLGAVVHIGIAPFAALTELENTERAVRGVPREWRESDVKPPIACLFPEGAKYSDEFRRDR